MSRVKPPPPEPPASPWATALGVAAALVLLADVPGLFTRGDLLRGALLPLLAAGTLWLGFARGGGISRADRGVLLLALLPALLVLPGALSISRPALASPAALARAVAPWLALSGLALGTWRLLQEERELKRLWTWVLGAGALAGAWLYVEWLIEGAGAGPLGRPGVAGPLLGALLGPALLLDWTPKPLRRALVAALLAAGCAFSASRTGWAVGGLAVLLALALAPERRLPRGVRRAAGLAALLGGLAAAALLTGLLEGGGTPLDVRRGVWRATAQLVNEAPFTGHGLGSFRAEVLRVRDLEEARLSRGREPFMAHNDVGHVSAEGGLLAGALLLCFGAGALLLAARAWSRLGRDPLAGAALTVLAAQAAASMAEQVLPDPAHVLLTALALATVLARRSAAAPVAAPPAPLPLPARLAVGLAATLLLACAALRARDVLADAHVRAYRDSVAGGLTLEALELESRERLVHGALAWRPDFAEAHYHHGVSEAERGRYAPAREAWRRALEVEPALTEARLDMAQSYALEGRREDALAALVEARRFDPTRYDLVLRQGHVALGPEPVPGFGRGESTGFDPLEPLRRYNEAALLAPERFETEVAFARVARRLRDLDSAGTHLRRAEALTPGTAETLFESFHLAEVEGGADERQLASILAFALAADVGLAGTIRREALACEKAALERSYEARAAATVESQDWSQVERAWSAFTVRALALLAAGLVDPDLLVREARAHTEAGDHRAALARQRALLAWTGDQAPADPAGRLAFFERRGNLLIEAAKTSSRFDGALARTFYAEGHLLKGLEFLERGLLAEARRMLENATSESPSDARPAVALARACARLLDLEAAEAALLTALTRDPKVAGVLASEADLAQVLPREKVRAALGR